VVDVTRQSLIKIQIQFHVTDEAGCGIYTQVGQEVCTVYRRRRNIPLEAVLKRIAKSGRTAVRSATVVL
jgi:hypothetical protein